MFTKKLFFIHGLLIFLAHLSFVQATIVDIAVMQFGPHVIILNGDHHRLDDSLEVWQAAALLSLAVKPSNPANFILIEENSILSKWDKLSSILCPDMSDTQSEALYDSWVKNLMFFPREEDSSTRIKRLMYFKDIILAFIPNHGCNNLSLLNLFCDAYQGSQPNAFKEMLMSVDHRQASVLIHSLAGECIDLFSTQAREWESDKILSDESLISTNEIIEKSLMQFTPMSLGQLDNEQYYMHQLMETIKANFVNNLGVVEKFIQVKNAHFRGRSNVLKAFAYLYDLELFNKLSCEELNARFQDYSLNQAENSVVKKIYSQPINTIINEALGRQTQYIFDQMRMQTRFRQKQITLFLKKRTSLFINLSCDALGSTYQIVELESLYQILKLTTLSADQPKKIMVLGGVMHMKELAEMLEMFGARLIDKVDIIDFIVTTEPKTSSHAFDLCGPINQKFLALNS